jgi:hypothetical protein
MERLTNDKVKRFVLGGNAIITLESGITSKHFTYKITRSKNDENLYFVKLLNGADNLSDYTYIGCYYADTKYFYPNKRYKGSVVYSWPKSLQAINFMFKFLDNIPDKLHVYHEGRCCVCGRRLTTPESIEAGVGPECAKYV